MFRLALPALLLAATTLLVACSGDDEDHAGNSESRLRVVATTTQIGDFATNVGGDRIDLTVLLSGNQDAHDFELEPSHIRAVTEADLVLRNGVGLDDFLDRALESSSAAVVDLSTGIETHEGGHAHEEDEGHEEGEEHKEGEEHEGHDPHIWFSVVNAKMMVQNLRDALSAEDAANATFYNDSAAIYLEELDSLDAEIISQVETVPPPCRKLVTNHGLLGYFAEAYGFEVVGSVVPATTSEAQASAADVAAIVSAIQEQGVPAIFSEASINPALVEQVGREAGIAVVTDLYGDSLGPEGSDGETYIGMMRSNTAKIVEALRNCEATG